MRSRPLSLTVLLAVMLLVAGCATGQEPSGGRQSARPARPPEKVEPLTGKVDWLGPKASADSPATVGSWTTEDVVVTVTAAAITGYDRRTGKQRWRRTPPAVRTWPRKDARTFCGASSNVVRGAVAVAIGVENDGLERCVGIALLDPKTGESAWEVPLVRAHEPDMELTTDNSLGVELVGDVVVVQERDRYRGVRRSDGADAWAGAVTGSQGCSPFDLMADDTAAVGLLTCSKGGIAWRVVRLDLRTGKESSSVEIESGRFGSNDPTADDAVSPALVGVAPLTVALVAGFGGGASNRLLVWRDENAPPAVIESPREGDDALDMSTIGVVGTGHDIRRILVGGGRLVAATGDSTFPRRNALVGYDTATGERAWSVPSRKNGHWRPIAIDGDAVLAADVGRAPSRMDAPVRVPTKLAEIALSDGAVTPLTNGYREYGVTFTLPSARLGWYRGKIYGVPDSPIEGLPTVYALR